MATKDKTSVPVQVFTKDKLTLNATRFKNDPDQVVKGSLYINFSALPPDVVGVRITGIEFVYGESEGEAGDAP
jgi:hypothetical protein